MTYDSHPCNHPQGGCENRVNCLIYKIHDIPEPGKKVKIVSKRLASCVTLCHNRIIEKNTGAATMNEVTKELMAMKDCGIYVSELTLAASRDDAEIQSYLNNCMSVSEVADLMVDLYNNK